MVSSLKWPCSRTSQKLINSNAHSKFLGQEVEHQYLHKALRWFQTSIKVRNPSLRFMKPVLLNMFYQHYQFYFIPSQRENSSSKLSPLSPQMASKKEQQLKKGKSEHLNRKWWNLELVIEGLSSLGSLFFQLQSGRTLPCPICHPGYYGDQLNSYWEDSAL